jgi:hypothetical protein
MSAIAAYRTAVLAILDDASKVRYTDNQVDQAIRLALQEYSRAWPLEDTYYLDTDGHKVLALPADFAAFEITKVELDNDDENLITSIPFYAYKIGGQWNVETTGIIYPAGEQLIITYACMNTIDGLDSAAGTSVLDEDEPILQTGAAGYAALSRATSRPETINMQPEVSAQLLKVAEDYLTRFREGIRPRNGAYFSDPPIMGNIAY